MPQAGDELIITFNSPAPLAWGTHRRTNTRTHRTGERYIPIPRKEAIRLHLCNQNNGSGLGLNIFNVRSDDGLFAGQLKTAGCNKKGDIFAKQFEGNGDLQALTPWLQHHNAQIGDSVRFYWNSSTDIVMSFIANH